jgi:hypothetical protein
MVLFLLALLYHTTPPPFLAIDDVCLAGCRAGIPLL